MDLVYIGKIVNTHGIKGELRLISDFEYKNRIFKMGKKIFIDNKEYLINSYRHHKIFDMLTLKGFENINDVLFLKNKKVYCLRQDLHLKENEYLIQDLIGFEAYFNEEKIGTITNIVLNKNPLITINKNIYIPYNSNFILNILFKEKRINLQNCEGLL